MCTELGYNTFKNRNLNLDNSSEQHSNRDLPRAYDGAIEKLCPPSCFHGSLSCLADMLKQEANSLNLLNITGNEVSIAIKEAKRHSTSGLDQVDNKIISSLLKKFTDALVEIFNGFLDMYQLPEVVPESWKKISWYLYLN